MLNTRRFHTLDVFYCEHANTLSPQSVFPLKRGSVVKFYANGCGPVHVHKMATCNIHSRICVTGLDVEENSGCPGWSSLQIACG